MSDKIKNQIVVLKQKLNEVWLEESDCSHFKSEKKAELKTSIVRLSRDIKDRYTVLIDEEEEAATRQVAISELRQRNEKLQTIKVNISTNNPNQTCRNRHIKHR
jgi:hypothetical protein